MLSISSWPTCVAVIVLANHADFNIILPRATERERESSFDIAISLSRSTASYSSETTSERKKKKKNTIPKNTLSNLFIHLFSSPRFSKRKEYIATWGEKIALFESERDGFARAVATRIWVRCVCLILPCSVDWLPSETRTRYDNLDEILRQVATISRFLWNNNLPVRSVIIRILRAIPVISICIVEYNLDRIHLR